MTLLQARDAALIARRDAGLGDDGPIPDLVSVVERSGGVLVFALPFGRESIAGLYERQRGVPIAAINSNDPPVRQRFTLAHEYGHHRLNHDAHVDATIDWRSSDPQEREANEFAGALLMPERAIDLWLSANGRPDVTLDTLVQLAAFFGVSASAARVRLQRLDRLNGQQVRSLDGAIAERQHLARRKSLGLDVYWDTLQASHQTTRLPAATERRALELVRAEVLSAESLAARLNTTPDMVLAKASGADDDAGVDE
jgi:Zn-dependent peptidase ImmA (M78 family)